MTTYGTISSETEDPLNTKRVLVSRARESLQTSLSTTRPWNQMIHPSRFTLPLSFFHSIQRIKTNAHVFRANYAILVVVVLFLTLLWHPISLILLILMMAAWLSLYFLRDDPLLILGYHIDERWVASGLLLVTMGILFLTSVANYVMVGVSVGVGVTLVHALLRDTEDAFSMDEEEAPIVSTAGATARDAVRLPPKPAASSTFTLAQ